jgi:hypothetical protein
MSDSALNDNAIFASFAVERNSAIWRSALSARRTPIASLARSKRLDCRFRNRRPNCGREGWPTRGGPLSEFPRLRGRARHQSFRRCLRGIHQSLGWWAPLDPPNRDAIFRRSGAVAPLHPGSTNNCDKRSPSPANSSIRGVACRAVRPPSRSGPDRHSPCCLRASRRRWRDRVRRCRESLSAAETTPDVAEWIAV